MSELGRAVRDAIVMLTEVFDDSHRLAREVDAQLAARGWHPTHNGRVTGSVVGPNYTSESWVLDRLVRIYTTTQKPPQIDRFLFFVILFSPENGEQAMCLAGAVTFDAPQEKREFWDGWDSVLDAVHAADRLPLEIPADVTEEVVGAGAKARALALPLCDLTDATMVSERIVQPLLAM